MATIVKRIVKTIPVVRRIYKLGKSGYKIYKFFSMSDRGYLSNKRERDAAKILDSLVDFRKILPNKKLLFGLINIGNFVEKHDFDMFLALIRFVDDGLLARNMNIQLAAVFDKALTYLEKREIDNFNDYVAEILAGKIDLPLIENEKQLFVAALSMMKQLTNSIVLKAETLLKKAEDELASYKEPENENKTE